MHSLRIRLTIICGLLTVAAINAAAPAAGQAAGPAQSDRERLMERQQAAIEQARNQINRSLSEAPAAETAGQPGAGAAPASGGAVSLWVVLSLVILAAGVWFFFHQSRQPAALAQAPANIEASGAATTIRAVLGKKRGAAGGGDINVRNPRFLELVVDNQLITAPERASLSERFQGNDFAVMLFLAEQLPSQKDLLGKLQKP